ncbi:MAG: RNA polymerase sigma factor [Candidatus Eiseniibacteriota bacterium]
MRAPPSQVAGRGPSPPSAETRSGLAASPEPVVGHWPTFDRDDLKRAQRGDSEALGRFFDHYCDRIFSVVYRFTGSVELGQDLTQDIFFKVRRHISHLDLERDPAPWLYTVAVNTCHDHRRSSWWRMSRHSVRLDRAGAGSRFTSRDASPEQALLSAENESRVQAAIGRLPPHLRMSVILHDFEGLAHDEIARILNIGHAAARKRHSRALRALAELLREDVSPW